MIFIWSAYVFLLAIIGLFISLGGFGVLDILDYLSKRKVFQAIPPNLGDDAIAKYSKSAIVLCIFSGLCMIGFFVGFFGVIGQCG